MSPSSLPRVACQHLVVWPSLSPSLRLSISLPLSSSLSPFASFLFLSLFRFSPSLCLHLITLCFLSRPPPSLLYLSPSFVYILLTLSFPLSSSVLPFTFYYPLPFLFVYSLYYSLLPQDRSLVSYCSSPFSFLIFILVFFSPFSS